MVTHNLCIDLGDQQVDMHEMISVQDRIDGVENELGYGGGDFEEDIQLPEGETEEVLREEGFNRRQTVLDKLFPLVNYEV